MEDKENWVKRTYVKYGKEIFDLLTAPPQFYRKTEEQVKLIVSIIEEFYPSSGKILDIPCGDGRISRGLSEKGYSGTGIDISPHYIEEARKMQKSGRFEFKVEDMRDINYCEKYDILINWFGSFGYFNKKTNQEILKKFYSALKENGIFIMDITNRDNYIRKMEGFLQIEPELVFETEDKKLYTKYHFNPHKSQIKTITRIGEDGPEVQYFMYYYSIHEVISMLEDLNFELLKIYGDYEGNDFSLNSPRIIAVTRKKY